MGAQYDWIVVEHPSGKPWKEGLDEDLRKYCQECDYEHGRRQGYSGYLNVLPRKVGRHYNLAFDGKDAEMKARRYMEDHAEKWEAPIAVSFRKNGRKNGRLMWLIGGLCPS